MPTYLVDASTWRALWPLVVGAVLLAALSCLLFRRRAPLSRSSFRSRLRRERPVFLIALAFATLGIVTGFLTGMSREPAVNAILPAVLSLFAGLAVYLIGKENHRRELVGMAVLSLASALLLGTAWGAQERKAGELYRESEEYLRHQACVEANLKMYRAELQQTVDDFLQQVAERAVAPGGLAERRARVAGQQGMIEAQVEQELEVCIGGLNEDARERVQVRDAPGPTPGAVKDTR